jgi:glutathione synthase
MALKVGVLMDPISTIKPSKDSTFAMLLEAQNRNHQLFYFEQHHLSVNCGSAKASLAPLTIQDHPSHWYTLGETQVTALADLNVILARKDPPFDDQFLYDTMILENAERLGVLVINRPQSLRDCNEKLFAQQFPELTPPTLVARDIKNLRAFVQSIGDAVLKPLDGMAGRSIFKTCANDPNLNVILETLTQDGSKLAMAQQFIPEAVLGDKRILMINGTPIPYALARIPQGTDFRGNMARGGRAQAQPLSERDQQICAQVGPELKKRGLWFVGLDVIGDYLTEINVTSPTGIRELDTQLGLNISAVLWETIEQQCAPPSKLITNLPLTST